MPARPQVHSRLALTPQGWVRNVRLLIENGSISAMQTDVGPAEGDDRAQVLIPAVSNVHSHAFQRGMAGLAEIGGPEADNFWSWRSAMYRFALQMNPDHVEAVAAQLYIEMLEAGFCRVGEFHYLHHDQDGHAYANVGEMAQRIIAAAQTTGIGLTLLPVFYAHSNFTGSPPLPHQRRFISTLDAFEKLLASCQHSIKQLATGNIGIAPHSLRAVTPDELKHLITLATGMPIHIHAAEQTLEVEDCLKWSGQRPVQWLLDHAEIGPRWCLIHATHMDKSETRRLASSKATAGLCPITEANLGDGIFPTREFLSDGGAFAIGSDSNILIGIPDELRQLEYAQRLRLQARNVLAQREQSSGRILFEKALSGGARALNTHCGLTIGKPADFLSLDTSQSPHLSDDELLDAWIFTKMIQIDSVWVGGHKCVTQGRHIHRDQVTARFQSTMQRLV